LTASAANRRKEILAIVNWLAGLQQKTEKKMHKGTIGMILVYLKLGDVLVCTTNQRVDGDGE